MSDVFVSYKAEDRRRVRPLVEALEADGLTVWWDAEIGGGAAWRQSIEAELEAARCVIVIWSKRSVGPEGAFVHDEASRALERRVYLPVTIDRVRPPLGFGERQSLPLTRWNGARADSGYRNVLAAVNAIIAGQTPSARTGLSAGSWDRRAVVAGCGAAVAATAAGGWFALRNSSSPHGSIAVLPFANLSGDPDQTYFSDGIAEELRSALSRIPGLTVVARTSSEAMREEDAKTAASKLKVANILTGSIRRSPSMIRITAQLIDGKSGLERWTENYDRAGGDALHIQTDIANKVADSLSIRLGGADRERLLAGATTNAEAHDLLLQAEASVKLAEGRRVWERAVGMANAALALDPGYANGLATKAWMIKVLGGSYASSPAESRLLYKQAEATARRAIEMAPQSSRSHGVLADILYEQLQPRPALVHYQKAVSLPGTDGRALIGYATFLGETNRTDEALQLIERALVMDPLNPEIFGWKGYIEAAGRRYVEAIASAKRVLELAPARRQPRTRIALYLTMLGRHDEAAAWLGQPSTESFVQLTYAATLAARTGRKQEAERLLSELEKQTFATYQIAEVLAQLGRKEEAIATLERAWAERDSGLTTILTDPLIDPLRNELGFKAVVEKINFPDVYRD